VRLVTYFSMLFAAFVLGITAGLRSMTPLAVVAWMALTRPAVHDSFVAFIAARATAPVLTALAVVELITDKLPFTPSRLTAVPLGARIVSGALCGAVVAAVAHGPLVVGAIVGAIGAVAGSFGGYYARKNLVAALKVPDIAVALTEDVVTIGLAILAASSI
jgi:uncharacterized membrane protein